MKHTATVALMLNLGVASVYAQQAPLTFSGTAESSPVVLQNGVSTTEHNFAGHGRLGAFTFRTLSASAPSQPPPSSGCALYGSVVAGGGVFRFEDGSLLIVDAAQGTDCAQFTPTGPVAHCIRMFKIAGGTGRFKGVPTGGTVTLDETLVSVLPDNPVLFAVTGTGTVSGAAMD
jgi:hypothetical protein